MKRKLGIMANCLEGISSYDALDKIKNAGFEAFFTNEYKRDDVKKIKEKATVLGLAYEAIHAPFRSINDIWLEGDGYLTVFEYITEAIDAASENAIPCVVVHSSRGWEPPSVNGLGFSRFDYLVEYAKKNGVTLVFENLRSIENITCIYERYKDRENVGFCFDCGHEHCYTNTVSMLDIFKSRLCCTHIHDNFSRLPDEKEGDFDLHLLPFDGTYDYEK